MSKYCRKVPHQCSQCGWVYYTCTCVQLHVQFAHALWLYEVMCELSMVSSHSVAKEGTAQPGISLQFHNKSRKKRIVRHETLFLEVCQPSGLAGIPITWLELPKRTLQLDLPWNTAYVWHIRGTGTTSQISQLSQLSSKASLFQTDFFPPPPCLSTDFASPKLWTRSTFTNEVRKAC